MYIVYSIVRNRLHKSNPSFFRLLRYDTTVVASQFLHNSPTQFPRLAGSRFISRSHSPATIHLALRESVLGLQGYLNPQILQPSFFFSFSYTSIDGLLHSSFFLCYSLTTIKTPLHDLLYTYTSYTFSSPLSSILNSISPSFSPVMVTPSKRD